MLFEFLATKHNYTLKQNSMWLWKGHSRHHITILTGGDTVFTNSLTGLFFLWIFSLCNYWYIWIRFKSWHLNKISEISAKKCVFCVTYNHFYLPLPLSPMYSIVFEQLCVVLLSVVSSISLSSSDLSRLTYSTESLNSWITKHGIFHINNNHLIWNWIFHRKFKLPGSMSCEMD